MLLGNRTLAHHHFAQPFRVVGRARRHNTSFSKHHVARDRLSLARQDTGASLPWCTTRDLGPQLSCTRGYEVPHEHFQTHSAEVCEEGLSREELA